MSLLKKLKNKSSSNLKSLQEKIEKEQGGGDNRDPRIWKPKLNKEAASTTVTVRFLPAIEGEPFVQKLSYSFNGPGGNFFGPARQMIQGEKDPVQLAAISAFRKAKAEDDSALREKAKKFLPKRTYYANVFVVTADHQKECEGKNFIWMFGPAIYNKLKAAIQPEYDDVEPIDPFDFWAGHDFKIRMKPKEIPDSRNPGQKVLVPDYDDSEFAKEPSEFMGGDEEVLEEIFSKTYDLSEFVSTEGIDDFDTVAKKFKDVMGHPYNWLSPEGVSDHVEEKYSEPEKSEPAAEEKSEPAVDHDEESTPEPESTTSEPEDDEDPVARFRRMARGG